MAASEHVVLLLLPRGTSVGELADAGLSPALLSAGLGSIPAEQTYLDIGQGNRVFDSLYDGELPALGRDCGAWGAVLKRAHSAPAEILPGLLALTLRRAGVAVRRGPGAPCALTTSAPRGSDASPSGSRGEAQAKGAPSFEVRVGGLGALHRGVAALRGADLLIALARPPPPTDQALAIGIAGRGFEGNLTSASTRLNGYVLSTDLAPTILDRFGVSSPGEMSGQVIHAEGKVDASAIRSLGARMAVIPTRRGPVLGLTLLAWALALALAAALSRGSLARPGVRLAVLAVIYLPLVSLLAAALEPSEAIEALLAVLGAPTLGLVTLFLASGYRALALASGLSVLAFALDVIAGSPLTTLALVGPNPILGVRFYGIGNEMEALLTVLVIAGCGAALSGFAPRLSRRGSGTVFVLVGIVFAFVFGAGRFGADVGAAIVLPFGVAVAAAWVAAARNRRTLLVVLVAPVVAVGLLAAIDLLSGANAHLTRSVLDAGGLRDLADVAQRRLQLSAQTFAKPLVYLYLPLLILASVWAILRRDRVSLWLRGLSALRAGLLGALAAIVLGTVANDSGGIILEIGSGYILLFGAYAWAEAADPRGRYS